MTERLSVRHRVAAAVTTSALEIVSSRVGDRADVSCIEDGADLSTIEFLVPGLDPEILMAIPYMPRLKAIQTMSAGSDRFKGIIPEQVTLCSARGARDAPVAEWVLGALLGASSHLLSHARTHTSRRDLLEDLGSWSVVIVGMGSIGSLVGSRLNALGTTVVSVASRAREGVHGVEELLDLLPTADAVVLLTPLTDTTRGMIDGHALTAMKDGAVLVNAARGAIVDTNALLAETVDGRLRAVLDVTDPEPLPLEHPLWSAPGVLSITPHIAGDSPRGRANAARFAGDQLARWCDGEELLNVEYPVARG